MPAISRTFAKPIPLDLCRTLFELRPETGELIRRFSRGRAAKGTNAIRIQYDGRFQDYRGVVWANKQKYQAQRVVLAMHLGHDLDPEKVVDHMHNDTLDHRPEFLREVTREENQRNRKDNKPKPAPPPAEEVEPEW